MQEVSQKAANLIGSEIIRLGNEINQLIKEGQSIYNLTIGDFNPVLFPIPDELEEQIILAYKNKQTNYPPADGVAELKQSVLDFISKYQGVSFKPSEIMIAGGGRPLIHAIYQTIVDPGEKVLYPVPSWNNNHYCHLSDAQKVEIETKAENGFMPTYEELKPFISDAVLLALCSPLNPTGTTFRKQALQDILNLVAEENERRKGKQKPLYILFDQIYWMLLADGIEHYNPLQLVPSLKPYVIFVDGISKSLSATGVRVGWSLGPEEIISKMKSILGHIGAWAPKSEQVATAHFLNNEQALQSYIQILKEKIKSRFNLLYEGFMQLKAKGYPVDIILPEGAIYVSVQFNLIGKVSSQGETLSNTSEITSFLLNNAQLAIVPFTAFGCEPGTTWYRVSVGTLKEEDVPELFRKLDQVLGSLKDVH